MALRDLPPDVQEQLQRFQQLEQNTRAIQYQLETIKSSLNETEATLKALEGLSPDDEVYKSVGKVMFKITVAKVREELEDKKEILELRKITYEKQERKSKQDLETAQKALQQKLGMVPGLGEQRPS
ncbi:MAG: prefoldin subunit beta [Candidatus Hodarchaeota archaeon]